MKNVLRERNRRLLFRSYLFLVGGLLIVAVVLDFGFGQLQSQDVELVRVERTQVRAGQLACKTGVAGVGVKRATAGLARGDHHLEAIARQDPRGGGVHRSKELRHDAAHEEADASAPRALGGNRPGQRAPCARRAGTGGNAVCSVRNAPGQQGGRQSIQAQAL